MKACRPCRPEEAYEFDEAERLGNAEQGRVETERGSAAVAAAQLDDVPIEPRDRGRRAEVEPESVRGGQIDDKDPWERILVVALAVQYANEEGLEGFEEEEDIDEHVEVERGVGPAWVVHVPEGELDRNDEGGVDEHAGRKDFEGGVERGSGLDQARALNPQRCVAWSDTEDGARKVPAQGPELALPQLAEKAGD